MSLAKFRSTNFYDIIKKDILTPENAGARSGAYNMKAGLAVAVAFVMIFIL